MLSEEAPSAKDVKKPAAEAPKKRGVDYSKFDNIVDSDDEKPNEKSSTTAAKAAPAEKPHCHNCMKDLEKPLKCGTCKKVVYCSPQCQKSDWSFHKRNCKKPEPEKKKEDEKKPAEKSSSSAPKPKKKEDKVVDDDDDEIPNWYRHREWKPDEGKKEFKPTAVSADSPQAMAAESGKPASGSVWNAAGTWEDKDVTELAKRTLKDKLRDLPSVDAVGGVLSFKDVSSVDGEASKPSIRGTQRHLFDLSFKATAIFKWMDAGGQQQVEASVSVADFTNDTSFTSSDGDPAMELSIKGNKLDASRKGAVEEAIGTKVWPPAKGSLMAVLADAMQAWTKEYKQEA